MLAFTRVHWLCCVATLLCVSAQDPPKPSDATTDERLSALIEKTNGLKSFVAHYHVDVPTGPMEMYFTYSAPNRIKLRQSSETQAGGMIWMYVDGVMTMHSQDEENGERFMSVEFLPIPQSVVAKTLDRARELFPTARFPEPSESAGAQIKFSTRRMEGEPSLEFNMEFSCYPRPTLLGWIPFLRKKAHVTAENAETLEFAGESESRFVLRKDSGFLESARIPCSGGEKTLKLKELEVGVAIDDEEFRAPKPSAQAQDDSAAMRDAAFANEVIALRDRILRGVLDLVDDGNLTWDDESKSKLAHVLETFHASILELRTAEWLEKALPSIDEFCWWFQSMRARADATPDRLAALDQEAESREQELRKTVEKCRGYYRPLQDAPKESLWPEFVEIDSAAFDTALSEQVEKPLVSHFTEQLALARAGKLTDPNEGKAPSPSGR